MNLPVNSSAGKNKIRLLAEKLIDRKHPGDFNQAIMEFGALYCKPQNPYCLSCIFNTECQANSEGNVEKIPVKNKTAKQQNRFFNYLVFTQKTKNTNFVFLKKRTGNDIWLNLYDFPLIESQKEISTKKIQEKLVSDCNLNGDVKIEKTSIKYRHVLSHQIINARFVMIRNLPKNNLKNLTLFIGSPLISVTEDKLYAYPLPRLIEKYLAENKIF